MKVGVIGCGVISRQYVKNAEAFDSFELVACADLEPAQSIALAKSERPRNRDGRRADRRPVDRRDPQPDACPVHAAVIAQALAAGKHVYTEKPVATDVGEALALVARGRAPRPSHRLRARHLPRRRLPGRERAIESGAIGEPLSVSAAMLARGDRRPGTRTPTSSTSTEPARCSTWVPTT